MVHRIVLLNHILRQWDLRDASREYFWTRVNIEPIGHHPKWKSASESPLHLSNFFSAGGRIDFWLRKYVAPLFFSFPQGLTILSWAKLTFQLMFPWVSKSGPHFFALFVVASMPLTAYDNSEFHNPHSSDLVQEA